MKKLLLSVLALGLALLGPQTSALAKINPTTQWGSTTADQLDSRFEMCFWNIYKAPTEQTMRDIDALVERSDILLLQEMELKRNPEELYNGHFAASWGTTGVATLSDVKQKKAKAFVSDSYEFGFVTPKSILLSHFDLAGQDLLVVNVHALNFVAFDAFALQMKELGKLVSKHEGPVLIAGDFNTWFFTRTELIANILGEHGITEIEFALEGDHDPRAGRFGLLDRAYARGLDIVATEIMDEMTSSDHMPSCVTLDKGI